MLMQEDKALREVINYAVLNWNARFACGRE